MDHLLYPTGTSIPTLRIPLLCDDETFYNGESFTAVPFRKGWASESNSHQWLQCSDEELARRVQIWLYFGLLSAFCGSNVSSASLCCVDQATHYRYLSTARLYDLLDKRKSLTNGRILIKEALHYSELVEQRVTADIGPLHLVSCSVRVLLQTLNSTQGLQIKTINSTQRYHMGQRWPLKWSEGLFENWRLCPAKAIVYKMEALGWCPAQISDLSQKYSCSALYYLSGLPVERSVNHSQCTKSACSAYNIDERSYISQHTLTCIGHKCSLIEVSSLSVSSIIEDGFGIPVISCSIDSGDRVRSEIIRAEACQEYTAISHVWSGGLGNPNQNGLPECQVRELIDRVRRLQILTCKRKGVQSRIGPDKEVLFWMDTFCIPVGENYKSTRRKAIDSMALIYSNASAILVLDPELRKLSYGGLGIEQALALVLRSSWMSRCWTLQEASLSKAWFIQFNDNPINIADAAKQSSMKSTLDFLVGRGKPLPSIKRALIAELSRFLIDMSEVRYQRRGRYSRSEIWNLKQLESHQALSFATAWNNFQGRTTSKQEDLHQILAGMADIRAGGLRDFALEDRMKAIVKCHASLPIDILFCPCERMHGDDPANAWAPNSPQGQRLDETFGSMKVFTDCLYISPKTRSEYLQICFGQSEALLADRFQVDIPTVGRFWIEIDNISPEQHHERQNRSICLMSPTLGSDSKAKVWSEILGARFIIQKQEGNNLHMIYDSPFRMFSYDRGAKKPSNDNPALQTYPYAPTELAHPDSRIFIDCSLESWPTAPLFYSSLEGPLYTKPAPYLQAFAYIIVHLTWTVSLITTLLKGPKFHIPRLPLIYCFLARVPFVVVEMFWYRRIFESIERDVWSLNVARNSQDFSSYDVINSRPLQLFGLKRGIGTLILAIVFTTLGFHYRDRDSKKWILWLGGMVLLEFTLRSVFYLCWYMLPRYSITRSWLERGKKTLFPKFQSWFVRAREQLVVRHERVPFNEEDAEPFEENAGLVLGLYGAFVKSFWGGGDGGRLRDGRVGWGICWT